MHHFCSVVNDHPYSLFISRVSALYCISLIFLLKYPRRLYNAKIPKMHTNYRASIHFKTSKTLKQYSLEVLIKMYFKTYNVRYTLYVYNSRL